MVSNDDSVTLRFHVMAHYLAAFYQNLNGASVHRAIHCSAFVILIRLKPVFENYLFHVSLSVPHDLPLILQENAKQSTSKRAVASENYECVHNLVQYYQMVSLFESLHFVHVISV